MHVFGVVEGEDDLILMGMVKDITTRFTEEHLAGLLGVIQSINVDATGNPLPREDRILRIGLHSLFKFPGRCFKATLRLFGQPGFWRLGLWIATNAVADLIKLPAKLIPTSMLARYESLPPPLREHARFAESNLRRLRWTWLVINMWFQLELTRTQLPLQRFGKAIEHLVSMLVLVHHSSLQDEHQQRVAAAQCEQLRDKFHAIRMVRGLMSIERQRTLLGSIADDIENDRSSLLHGVTPHPFAHDWRDGA